MQAEWIENPLPVWGEIKDFLTDDTKELETKGQFLGVFDGEDMAGAFLIKPWSQFCFEMHGGVARDYWGKGAEICDLAGRTLFFSTPCLKIVAIIPRFRFLMRRCVESIGLKEEGVITKSYLKWNKLHDQIVYGITKTELRNRSFHIS